MSTQWMIAFKGPAGSGKSRASRALGQHLRWPVIDKDDSLDYLEDHQGGAAYDIMFRVAERQLQQGLNVMCDSPLGYGPSYAHARQIAEARVLSWESWNVGARMRSSWRRHCA